MKEIYCLVHSTISIPDTIMRVVDTPAVQRLRHIKQLGAASYVYPTATHSRFEHSLGVGHLGRRVMDHLQRNGVPVTNHQKDLIQLAGILHDVGHGPYSHLFEQVTPESHEDRSCAIIRELLHDTWSADDVQFVCDVVSGTGDGFLYEIIHNRRNGFDVDKWDYVVRDSTMVGFRVNVDFQRFITNIRVLDNHIYFNQKCYDDIYEVYRMRCLLHRKVYNHHAVVGIERLLIDILRDIDAKATDIDAVIHQYPTHPLVQRLYRRDHYRVVATNISDAPLLPHVIETPNYILLPRAIGLSGSTVHPMSRIRLFSRTGCVVVKPGDHFVSEQTVQYWTRLLFKSSRQTSSPGVVEPRPPPRRLDHPAGPESETSSH